MYVINLKYIKEMSFVEEYLPAHIEFLNKFYDKGNFIFSGRKVPRDGGIIICAAGSDEEVNNIISKDPFYINKVAQYTVTHFIPTKTAPKLVSYKESV